MKGGSVESFKSFFVKLLNLPVPEKKEGSPPDAANAWQAASAATRAAEAPSSTPWTPMETTRKQRAWTMLIRWGAAAVIVLLCLLGIRQLFRPDTRPVEQNLPVALQFPQAAAQGIASRFATAYYSWDETTPDSRAKALSADYAGGSVESGRFGWNGKGKQTASQPYVVGLDVRSPTEASVTVGLSITVYKAGAKAGEWQPDSYEKRAVAVPIVITEGRPTVTGTPSLVAIPQPGQPTLPPQPGEDTTLSQQTKDYATSFFQTYGTKADTSAVTAPGASIPGLEGAAELEQLTRWVVRTGSGDERPAEATVRWKVPGGATLDQSYKLTLTKVSAGQTDRWQIIGLSVGTN